MHSRSLLSKNKKIVIIVLVVTGAASVTAYFLFPSNPVIAASLLASLPLIICPVACGVVGLAFWLNRFSSK